MREIDLQTAVNEIVASTRRRREHGEFPFFFIVGAGISHPPIPLASGIEQRCQEKLISDGLPVPILDGKSALDRYQTLFESAYPQAEDRQEYLHQIIYQIPVSAANLRLAHLLGELQLANLVFTPNFDEMLSRSLRLLGYDVAVCDHPKTTARIKTTRTNLPQIVHVHGTHWFYDCCNLRDEIVSQAQSDPMDGLSMGQLLDRVLADHSPIVIGYSGWDGDVLMASIRRRLRQPMLPRNLYWFCYRRSELDTLPSWLKDHASVRMVLPPPSSSSGNELALPAQTVFEAFVKKLEMKLPRLTREPLEFFSEHLAMSLPSEEDSNDDLYLIRQAIDRVRRVADLERE